VSSSSKVKSIVSEAHASHRWLFSCPLYAPCTILSVLKWRRAISALGKEGSAISDGRFETLWDEVWHHRPWSDIGIRNELQYFGVERRPWCLFYFIFIFKEIDNVGKVEGEKYLTSQLGKEC
jgi:hypothetical protein